MKIDKFVNMRVGKNQGRAFSEVGEAPQAARTHTHKGIFPNTAVTSQGGDASQRFFNKK